MSYKCAILGHDYGEVEVERDREEDGNEVVITVRETKSCARCGEQRVVSENKEVTTLETAADIVSDDLDGEGEDGEDAAVTRTEEASEPEIPEAESTVTAGASQTEMPESGSTVTAGASQTEMPESGSTVTAGASEPEIPDAESTVPEEATDPETDDGIILDDEPDDTDEEEDREPGAWPEEESEEETTEEDAVTWPEEEREEKTADEDAVTWPDEETDEGDASPDWELPSDIDPHPETSQVVERTVGSALTVPEGEFHCPECGFTTSVESSSLRAGDFCPECRQGALEHRAD